MKMIMIICPEDRREEIRRQISAHELHAYTELKNVTGEGATGKKFGTTLWPEKSIIVFSVISDDRKDGLLKDLQACSKSLFPGEGMRVFVLPVEEAI
jgi:nitrogen regulatory protein PII